MTPVDDGQESMCDHCPDNIKPVDVNERIPCRFWLQGQPCPPPEAANW